MRKASLISACFYATTICCLAQPMDVADWAKIIEGSGLSAEMDITNPGGARQVLSAIRFLISDSSQQTRFTGYSILGHFNDKKIAPNLRRQAVELLLEGWADIDSGISGHVSDILFRFGKPDFPQASRKSLARLLGTTPAHYDKMAKLAGYLEMTDQRELLASQLQSNRLNKRDAWAVRVALCRLGDQVILDEVLTKARQISVTDESIDIIYRDLIYTRQAKAVDFVVDQIISNNAECDAPNPEIRQSLPCVIHLIRLLSRALVDFPIAVDSNGDFLTNEYATIVSRAREWLKRGKYKIRTDNF